MMWVYSKNLSQFPHTETSAPHNPNLSATADKNPAEIESLKKSLINFLAINLVFCIFNPFNNLHLCCQYYQKKPYVHGFI